MSSITPILKHSPLFNTISDANINALLGCLSATQKVYHADECIFSTGTQVDSIYIVLKGRVELVKETLHGDRSLLSLIEPCQLFAEGIVCTSHRLSPLSAYASTTTTLLLIPYERITLSCSSNCLFHIQLIRNMLTILGNKNYSLNTKLDFMLIKGIKQKVAAYLMLESKTQQSLSFNITLNRNELAEFLNVSRPSMSRELAVLKSEGIIDYYKNSFKIIDLDLLADHL